MGTKLSYKFIIAVGFLAPLFLSALVFPFPFFQKLFGIGFANVLFMWFMNVSVPYIFFIGVIFYFLDCQKTLTGLHKIMYAAPLGLVLLQGVYWYGWYFYLKLLNQVPPDWWTESFEIALYTLGIFYACLLLLTFTVLKGSSKDDSPPIAIRKFNEKNFGMSPPSFFFFVVGMILLCISSGKIIFEVMEVTYSRTHADYANHSIDFLEASLGILLALFMFSWTFDEKPGYRIPYLESVAYKKKKTLKTFWKWVYLVTIVSLIAFFYYPTFPILWILGAVISIGIFGTMEVTIKGSDTMSINYHCPYCNGQLNDREILAQKGGVFPCPKCSRGIVSKHH